MPATYNNIPVAFVDPDFVSHLEQLKEHGRRIYISTLVGDNTLGACNSLNTNQRRWQMPEPGAWNKNLFDITGLTEAYDRGPLNRVYMRAFTKGPQTGYLDKGPEGEGRVSDCMAMKIQIDYLAIQERAFRLRHSSSVRCSMHAAVRRRGQSVWNDAQGAAATLRDLGAGVAPGADDISGPVGGVFTSMYRYLLLIIRGGYNEGPVDIVRPDTQVVVREDGSYEALPVA
jgi:hypothetical protein